MTMTTKLYAMPIIIKDGNFIGFVTRPFTRSEMRESLRSLGFTKDDADCWDADLPTEYEIPSGFDPEAQALAVIQLSGGDRWVFMLDLDEVDTWPQCQVTYEEIAW